MVTVTGGVYRAPTLARAEPARPVASFRLSRFPVTNADFLAFVAVNPSWQRDQVSPLVADDGYLRQWSGPLALGPESPAHAPVTGVSWFAARAYCAAAGGRLPTEAEWELAAAASPTERDGRRDPAWRRTLLDWYARPNPARLPDVGGGAPNAWGLRDMHGLVWEWVSDFSASMLVGNDARLCGAGAAASADPLDYPAFLRAAFRSAVQAKTTTPNLGFRCAAPADPGGAS
jgi:formylglycine-generating enzyme required for sulfatase activity